MENRVNTVLIASGGGTDANAIMEAYCNGFIPNIFLRALISTKEGAGCLEKAKKWEIPEIIIDRKKVGSEEKFNKLLAEYLKKLGCDLVFLVGCIVKIHPIDGVTIYNIHPADPHDFGGNGMYGLKVHERVIANIEDLIIRGKKKTSDKFFTCPTVHEAVLNYDSGQSLLRANVEIPRSIIEDRFKEEITLTEAAERLQKYVLPYEWLMLPTAVNMAARRILDNPQLDLF